MNSKGFITKTLKKDFKAFAFAKAIPCSSIESSVNLIPAVSNKLKLSSPIKKSSEIKSLVVPAILDVMALFSSKRVLKRVLLPAFGGPNRQISGFIILPAWLATLLFKVIIALPRAFNEFSNSSLNFSSPISSKKSKPNSKLDL